MEIKLQTIGKFLQNKIILNFSETEDFELIEETVDDEIVSAVLPFCSLEIDGKETETSLVVLVPFTPVKNNAITLVVKGACGNVHKEIFGE